MEVLMLVKLVGGPLDGLQRSFEDGKPLPALIEQYDHKTGAPVMYRLVNPKLDPPEYRFEPGGVSPRM